MASSDFIEQLTRVSGGEHPLVIVEINHPNLTDPIRVINDNEDLVHNGEIYTGVSFRIGWIDQPEVGLSEARLSIDNVGRIATQYINETGGRSATATIGIVLRSNPDDVEIGSITLNFTDIEVTNLEISGRLSFKDIFNLRANPLTYNSSTAVGLL